MSLISFSPIQDGVTGVNAAATNTPLSTIYNDYNGNITDANISASAAIAGSKIVLANASVTPSKLGTGAATATVATSESTSSGTAADLATVGPSVTVTVGANGLALVLVQSNYTNSSANASGLLYVTISGATTVAATQIAAQRIATAQSGFPVGAYLATGLNAGSTTFKLQYSTSTGTATFASRVISVIPL